MDNADDERNENELPPITLRPTQPKPYAAVLNGAYAAICLYLFLCAINIMSSGLTTLGEHSDWLERLLANASNPFVALMGSVLITAVVQSSSFTTSLLIALVAAGQLPMETAVYCVMGANIGTSVTSILVSLGSVRIRRQFRRAFTAALVHDIFNWLTVAVLFPLEWITSALASDGYGWLTRLAIWLAHVLGTGDVASPHSPIKFITSPLVWLFDWFGQAVMPTPTAAGILVAILGLALLLTSLVLMVKNLKGALLRHIERLFSSVLFRNDATAYVVGALATILVQSSSITTSLIIPLSAAGAVKLKRVFAYILGANLGTTVTGLIAASANPVANAVTVAIVHVAFNAIGTAIWYPLRGVPLRIARWYGRLASKSKRYALLFLVVVFVVVPVVGVFLTELFFN